MADGPLVMGTGIFASWGFIEWSITASVTALGVVAGLLWRLGTKVGTYQTQFAAMRLEIDTKHRENVERAEHFDSEISKLRENYHSLGLSIAGLPDAIMMRLDPLFREINRRIDEVLPRRRED